MARPEKPINWDLVDELIRKQNSGAEIASHFNLHPETFYIRVQEKWETNFTGYAGIVYSQGKSLLRNKQWDKAMEGNVPLLLKLGEVYLGQRENVLSQTDQQLTVKLIDARSDSTKQIPVPPISG